MRLKRVIKTALTAALACAVAAASAQNPAQPRVRAAVEPDSIAIGDRFVLKVDVEKDLMQVVDFPKFENNLIGNKIEILGWQVDTTRRQGRDVVLTIRYLMTVFDEGTYTLGRFPVLYADKNITDTLWSEDSLTLEVGTFEIDSTSVPKDIKAPLDAPLKAGEVSGYILYGLLAAALLAALVYYWVKRRRQMPLFGKPKPAEPPHVIAIKALEELKNQKVWQNNRHKLYYSRLTDILREYIDGRWEIRAREMTSDEIMERMNGVELPDNRREELRRLLSQADLVKFAKYIPEAEENENAYLEAYYFVEETKPAPPDPEQTPAGSEPERKEERP